MEKKTNPKVMSEDLDIELTTCTSPSTKAEGPTSFMQKVKKIMNPPIVATLVAIPLALIPYIKPTIFLGSGAIFENNFMKSVQMMGGCASPLISIILGSNLSYGYPRTADISK